MYRVPLPRIGTFDAWRAAARALAGAGVSEEDIVWQLEGAAASLFDTLAKPLPEVQRAVKVPKAFPGLARLLCASREPGAFDLAYRLLTRAEGVPRLLSDRADRDVAQAEVWAKNIRRDMHKMKAFVRFREVTQTGANRRGFIAWFEPDHRIEELTAGFFARRFADMDWAIVTPEMSVRFEDGALRFALGPNARPDLSDETEELWRTYYANIFNPARLKVQAMQSEMPKKYWKNLPEADLIPGLIADAEAKVAKMRAAQATQPPVRALRVLDRLQGTEVREDGLLAGLKACTRCALCGPATQVVPGEGPMGADLMIVGEQPGDQEDLAGRPFVGPAGQLFDRLAAEAGLDRQAAYVTNAVKHFKFEVRGKRRVHQTPAADEVQQCRWWLEQELALVRPRLILALGATAALALTGDGKKVLRRRGQIEAGLSGVPVFLTIHPSAILRQHGGAAQQQMERQLGEDLAQVARLIGSDGVGQRLPSEEGADIFNGH